jgi:L-glyceraldehyde 3-phosphate reductase
MSYKANEKRYSDMIYNRCGKSGIKLPAISFGLWQNFGENNSLENIKAMIFRAFDLGITHFDIANNYGPPYGSAEENFGRILSSDLKTYRDELIISTKAGYDMWPGPYGNWGSKKYLVSSLDQSLQRLGLDYVDIYYHHRVDPETPLEETMSALDLVVKQGKALYVGLSNYGAEETKKAAQILKKLGTPCLINQASYSMFNRWIEDGLEDATHEEGIGIIAFRPLAMGLLTDKYLNGIPETSRAAHNSKMKSTITEDKIAKAKLLNEIAKERDQSLAQMSLAWILRKGLVTSALIGASKVNQIEENLATLNNLNFSNEELEKIEEILR